MIKQMYSLFNFPETFFIEICFQKFIDKFNKSRDFFDCVVRLNVDKLWVEPELNARNILNDKKLFIHF